ncbi:transcriptional regulator [Gluconacetobacter azotocaptans DSM 13594]|nr:transcriptional regulator [Gluconacetobacter azotocaptans DSM 13594]
MSSALPDLSGDASIESLAASAYGRLRTFLFSGELPAGALIQERRLAEQLGLSRTPVRDALSRLEGERLLSRNGRLLFVATVSVREIIDILHIRRLIEGDAARMAATRMTTAQIEAIRGAILGMEDGGLVTDDAHWANDDLLHRGIADASGNRELSRLIGELRQRTRMFGLTRLPERFDRGKDEHLAILDAIAARDCNAAEDRMRLHLDRARDAIISMLQGQDD